METTFDVPDNCCTLYYYADYDEPSWDVCLTEEDHGYSLVKLDPINTANSWKCGANVFVEFCNTLDSFDDCNGTWGESAVGPSQNPYMGLRNMSDFVRLTAYNYETDRGAVNLFTTYHCEETSGAFFSGANGATMGYPLDRLRAGHMPNDSCSSVQVPPGYTLELFVETFDGDSVTFEGMLDDKGRMAC
jgi:hypothetical protein